jgi:hypothetical protein
MTRESTRTRSLHGDLVAGSAVRGVCGHRRRRTQLTASTEAATVPPTNPTLAGEDSSPPAAAPRSLRRWSVAELIARATAPAPPPAA